MTIGKKCMIGSCQNIVVAKELCAKHYKRSQRHGHVLETRAADWGSREKHPLYRCWNALMRYHRSITETRWTDFWNFVADLGDSRPSPKHVLTRQNDEDAYGPQNFYWKEPRVSTLGDEAKASRARNMRVWYAANSEKVIDTEMRKRYGITLERYNQMLAEQGGVCAICGQEETRVDHRTKRVSRLAVDHDHITGAVRGLLCHGCNNSLGATGDDPVVLAKAIVYLASHSGDREAVITAAVKQLLAIGADHGAFQ